MINWVFDDPQRHITMSACPDTVIRDDRSLERGRFPVANLFWYWMMGADKWPLAFDIPFNGYSVADRPSRYAYNIGTWLGPDYWAGWHGNPNGFRNLFDFVPHEVLQDVRNNRAMIVIDGLNEGFQDDRLYEFWHRSCAVYDLPAQNIVYATSNEREPDRYSEWAAENHVRGELVTVIAWCHFEYMFQLMAMDHPSPTWEQHMARKRSGSLAIKTFNCLNRVNRDHRQFFLLRLLQDDLARHGLVSHDSFDVNIWSQCGFDPATLDKARSILPLVVDDADFGNNKSMQFNPDIYLRSWFTVVTETHADDTPNEFFMSEKIWKPMHGLSPFMVLGHRGTLRRLREMGYRTFGNVIDESYDDLELPGRIELLIRNLRFLHLQRDKLGLLQECRDAITHNKKLLMSRDFFSSDACAAITHAYERLDG